MVSPNDPVFDESEPVMLDAGCVRVVPAEPRLCPDCGDETGKTITHAVIVLLVNNGQDTMLEEGCMVCMEEFASRLKASLPEEKPE